MRFFLLFFLFSQLFAAPLVKGKLGYRYGYMQTELESYMVDGTFLFADSTTLKGLHFFQTALESDLFLMRDCFLRINGGYAFLLSGYNNEDSVTKVFERRAVLQEGGLGFGDISLHALFTLCFLKIGPCVGFYFQQLSARTINGTTNIYPKNLEEVEYISRWRVPKWGVLTQCKVWHFLCEASYFYGSSNWQGNWRLKGRDLPDEIFSEKRTGQANSGHIVSLRLDQSIKSWRIGCSFAYEYFTAKNGLALAESAQIRRKMQEAQVIDLVPKTRWQSFQVNCEVGVLF